jgi:hypothetical protein
MESSAMKSAKAVKNLSLAEDLFGLAVGVNIGRIEHGNAGVETDIDEPLCLGHIAGAPGFEELGPPAEGAGPETQHRDRESRRA